jgi:hypothetical protein
MRIKPTNLPPHGSDDGKWIFESIFAALKKKMVAKAA